ncbi:hypothetical protein TBLA_0C02480 [Henningerozyma blattae CBS 6284]|uniref:Uncharacterized protein n=1 Tax=Henningerozyma blattae (strain ATCC 34711 / CBS 6284 / DSM 70876 / NBRC 10599 / NRRL Y-10934 / UCD 77-7) TaxID=1071380 RepID=I2H106_HENB6|nr:hypothetical protein TBLA_0C02480 [Tetrapisispora blattae CBS 6284]CCH60058.1 hypothetical protein TBLA_0C02480 [Tetrapisispora blattae CBS 6284]
MSGLEDAGDNTTQMKKSPLRSKGTVSKPKHNSKAFKISNSIITKQDIQPITIKITPSLPPSPVNSTSPEENNGAPSTTTILDTKTIEQDMLFTPITDQEDDDDIDDILSPIHAQLPVFTKPSNLPTINTPASTTLNSNYLAHGTATDDTDFLLSNKDFWKTVDLAPDTVVVDNDAPSLHFKKETRSNNNTTTTINIQNNSSLTTIITQDNSPKNAEISIDDFLTTENTVHLTKDNSQLMEKQRRRKNIYNFAGSKKNMAGKFTFRNSIRRKSGVWEMVSTGIGINEFMI